MGHTLTLKKFLPILQTLFIRHASLLKEKQLVRPKMPIKHIRGGCGLVI